jgi:two-component system OmpR family response regulator
MGTAIATDRIVVGVCEDDTRLRAMLGRALDQAGYRSRMTGNGRDAVAAFTKEPPDVLILDIGLPDADGRDVCQALRAHGVHVPVIFLTARDALVDRLAGFHAGGDDYVTKPFAIAELVARIQVAARRRPDAEPVEATEEVRVDQTIHGIRVGQSQTTLTPTELLMIAALTAKRGKVVHRHELRAAAWPTEAIVNDNTIDSYILRLRRKLRELRASEEIETLRGVGYVLRPKS